MNALMMVVLFMYMSGLWMFCLKRKHLLVVLLSLEYMMLMMFMMIMLMLMSYEYSMYMLMVFLVFVVCEGALGLGILVSMIRSYGNDFFFSYSLLRC
uniref:NADH-ubiquinone oxidoreductase chain 4L n=1 Tax=Polionemobius taprobanensis TaxID=269706 RepID=A0A6B9VWQ3_9ORTH|nr:NADH dehydrogenase subunit 4L [Polionemobius taprobanensis]QHQ73114.1 NADH dehydrogenase subunit 4L [Polionemobius taprobanensis]WBK17699.1 NADH dehydrogenase subunit 4L [Polionemobius taprobanensis]